MELNKIIEIQKICEEYNISLEAYIILSDMFAGEGTGLIADVIHMQLFEAGLVTDKGRITPKGEILMSRSPVKRNVTERFEEFWNLFPKSTKFKQFDGVRKLQWKKIETKAAYDVAAAELGEEYLITQLKNEVKYRQLNSTDTNLFMFMCNSLNWFLKKAYLEDYEIEETNEYFGKDIE